MAIKAIFVGINKHLDSSIPELSGARRDATALWALFTDTIEGLSARLLVDEAATHTEVSSAMLGTLAAASSDATCQASTPPAMTGFRPFFFANARARRISMARST